MSEPANISLNDIDDDLVDVAKEFDRIGVVNSAEWDVSISDNSLRAQSRRGVASPKILRGLFGSTLTPDEEDWAEVSGIPPDNLSPATQIHRTAVYVGASIVSAVMAYPGPDEPDAVDDAIRRIVAEAKTRTETILGASGADSSLPIFFSHKSRLFRSQCDAVCRQWVGRHQYGISQEDSEILADIHRQVVARMNDETLGAFNDSVSADRPDPKPNAKLFALVGKIEVAGALMEEIGVVKFDYGHANPMETIALAAANVAAEEIVRAGSELLKGRIGESPDDESILFMSLAAAASRIYRSVYRLAAQEDVTRLLDMDELTRSSELAQYLGRDNLVLAKGLPTRHIHEKFRVMFRRMIEICSPADGVMPVQTARESVPVAEDYGLPEWLNG